MSRGYPSMTALLGLLAIAGYQNRDKIAEMLGGLGQGKPGAGQGGLGGLLSQLKGSLGRCQCWWGSKQWSRRTPRPVQTERPGGNREFLGKNWS